MDSILGTFNSKQNVTCCCAPSFHSPLFPDPQVTRAAGAPTSATGTTTPWGRRTVWTRLQPTARVSKQRSLFRLFSVCLGLLDKFCCQLRVLNGKFCLAPVTATVPWRETCASKSFEDVQQCEQARCFLSHPAVTCQTTGKCYSNPTYPDDTVDSSVWSTAYEFTDR